MRVRQQVGLIDVPILPQPPQAFDLVGENVGKSQDQVHFLQKAKTGNSSGPDPVTTDLPALLDPVTARYSVQPDAR